MDASVKEEENRVSDQSHGDEESCGEEIVLQVGAGKRVEDDEGMKPPSPNQRRLTKGQGMANVELSSPEYVSRSCSPNKRDQLNEQLESAKAEMDEVIEENQRLKLYLDRILKDYRALQTRYDDVVRQDKSRKTSMDHTEEEPEFVALSLGRTSSTDLIKDEHRKSPAARDQKVDKEILTLGLDCKFEEPKNIDPSRVDQSPENSIEELKEETWSNNKTEKNARNDGDEDISLQNPAKRARVSVRIRCDTPTMNDGCQWRKYGQKIAKGNPCPRAYYRCTVAPSCPVRKQVQRCADDMSILITTYEGTHNHPLSVSATAMASTTAAAASMLMSGSTTSGSGLSSSSTAATTTLNNLNFYVSDTSRSKPFYLPNSSISSSPSYPTITLDLTSSSSSSSSHLSRLGNMIQTRYPSTNLNFSSLESNALPISWSNGVLANYGSNLFNKSQSTTSSLNFGAQNQETLHQSFLHKNPNPNPNNNQQSVPSDTIAAATKAITSDPSFQSALAAALSSIIGWGPSSASSLGNQSIGEILGQNITSNSTEPFPILSSFPSAPSNANKCTPSFLNNSSSSTSSQPGGLKFLSPSFPIFNSKSKSNSPGDSRDHLI